MEPTDVERRTGRSGWAALAGLCVASLFVNTMVCVQMTDAA